jgi:hypothetical protein
MTKRKKNVTFVSGLLLACLIFLFVFAPLADADTTYTYTGNPFTSFHGSSACPPQCKITGSFTIAGPPPVNLTLSDQQFQFDITPLAYSFTDGNTTWTNANSCPDFFAISTDASGNITNWVMRIFTPSLNAPCAGGGIYTGFQLLTSNNAPGTIDIVIEAPAAVNFAAIPQDPGTWSMQNGYKAFVQPPINADGSSVFSAKRGVVPVKFTLTQNDVRTCTLPPATISVTRTAGGTLGSIDESIYLTPADSGSNFRIDPTACQYIYNLATSSLGVGAYRVDMSIEGIVVGHAVFALQ